LGDERGAAPCRSITPDGFALTFEAGNQLSHLLLEPLKIAAELTEGFRLVSLRASSSASNSRTLCATGRDAPARLRRSTIEPLDRVAFHRDELQPVPLQERHGAFTE
jgi:hypothetical protein